MRGGGERREEGGTDLFVAARRRRMRMKGVAIRGCILLFVIAPAA